MELRSAGERVSVCSKAYRPVGEVSTWEGSSFGVGGGSVVLVAVEQPAATPGVAPIKTTSAPAGLKMSLPSLRRDLVSARCLSVPGCREMRRQISVLARPVSVS